MAEIHVLPIHLVNKIAAGEVIERPASVVKELIENSLDGEATRIDVAVEDGGRKSIQVSDDGRGMSGEDLALACAPHATSKITTEDDLFHVGTMGFRGEALASIASISHAHIRTRPREGDDSGHEVQASGEQIGEVRPCPAGPGTTIVVRDLFFNTPARRKFMRTANTELAHIVEQIARLALPHPHVAFTLTHNGRSVKNLPAVAATSARVGDLFGRELGETLLPIVRRGGAKVEVAGLIAPPAAARATGKWQYFFLNGRYIRDRLLSHALREAYRGLLDPNLWPVAFIFLRVEPAEVDVNVHPTKIEVRFQNGQLVHGELLAALRETLNRAQLSPSAVVSGVGPPGGATVEPMGDVFPADEEPGGSMDEQRRTSLKQALADFFKSAPPPQPRLSFPDTGRPHGGDRAAAAPPPVLYPPAPSPGAATPPATATPPTPAAIQVHNSYIVSASEDGLVIIDQHALHERILYNDLRRRLAEGRLDGQRMLIPATFQAAAAEADAIQRNVDLLARLGIEVASFGPDTLAVQQFPMLLAERGVPPVEFIRELLDKLAEDETTDSERLLADVLAMMACKAAVKAGDPLTPGEIDSLLARGRDVEKASSCPHGRPTTLRLTLRDLEKQFKRG